MTDAIIYVDGKLVPVSAAAISPVDRGFALGDGVFETMRVENGRAFRLREHLRRLRRSLARLEIELHRDDAELEAAIRELLARNSLTRASVRLTVSRGVPETRGVLPGKTHSGPTTVIQAVPFAGYPAENYAAGFAAIVASIRRNESSPAAYVKSCNYLDSVFVRMAAAAAGADEGIMLNMAGNVACGSVSNVFVVKNDILRTPPLNAGILPGIARATVIEVATRERLSVAETDVTLPEIRDGDEAFLTNSLMGVMPLTSLDSRPIGNGSPGQVTRKLRELYEDLVQKESQNETI